MPNKRKKQLPEYRAYHDAKNRCRNVNIRLYPIYGGRGIEFRYNSFEQFISDIGMKPSPKHSLDRINNNGHYEIGNCRWATHKEQQKNKNKTQHLIKDRKAIGKYSAGVKLYGRKYQARIYSRGIRKILGTFATEHEAAEAYRKARIDLRNKERLG